MSMTGSDRDCLQVRDDVPLLDLMVDDHRKQHALYGTTNYYQAYDVETIPYLRNVGLADYRSKAPSTISSFGAVDEKMPAPDERTVRRLLYYHAERYGFGSSARPLSEVEISRYGNPEDIFEIGGKFLTPRGLRYYMRYGYVGRYLDWGAVSAVAELGPGAGTQAEVIGKLHPNIALLLFDLPPQLYVCESYLKAVFGERVVSYRQNRDAGDGFRPERGKIYIFGNWQVGILLRVPFDLFWSAACLCATEPAVAENYLGIVDRSPASMVYLMENFEGLFNAAAPGQHGVIEKTTMKNYVNGLSHFALIDKSPHHFEDSSTRDNYENSFWRRKG